MVGVEAGVDVLAVLVEDGELEEAHPASTRNRIQHSERNIARRGMRL
jgi:hypothetical protein